jgi:Fe-S-cluster containining protein
MSRSLTPLTRILTNPDFEPFSGPSAKRVLENAKRQLIEDDVDLIDIVNAISSLRVLTRDDSNLIYELQEKYCNKCGKCCRNNKPMDVTKRELKTISEYQHISYKKLKKHVKALPNGDGSSMVTRNPCPFLSSIGCAIYPIRPSDCKFFLLNQILSEMKNNSGPRWLCHMTEDFLAKIVVKRSLEEKHFKESK